MKIKIVCEGKKTELGLRKLIGRILDDKYADPETRRKISVTYDFMNGVPEVLKQLPAISTKSIEDGCELVICLVDLHRIHEHFTERLRNHPGGQNFLSLEIPERVRWLKENIVKRLIPAAHQEKVVVHVAQHEIEAWLISDLTTLGSTLRKRITDTFPSPEAVNDEKPPKQRLKEKYGYKESSQGKKCLEDLNYQLAMEKCQQFKLFIEDILKISAQATTP